MTVSDDPLGESPLTGRLHWNDEAAYLRTQGIVTFRHVQQLRQIDAWRRICLGIERPSSMGGMFRTLNDVMHSQGWQFADLPAEPPMNADDWTTRYGTSLVLGSTLSTNGVTGPALLLQLVEKDFASIANFGEGTSIRNELLELLSNLRHSLQ